jgi:hypothetical protein
VVAGAADEIVEASAFATEDKDAIAGEVEAVVIGGAALVETDDPEVLALEIFEGADEVDDAGDAEVLCCPCAGLDGNGAERGGAAFGEDDAVDACAIGNAEQSAEVLGVFDSVESEHKAGGTGNGWGGGEEVFNGEQAHGFDHGNDALVGWGLRAQGELVARLLQDADAKLAAEGDELFEAQVVALAGHNYMVKLALAGLEGFLNRVHSVQNFHEG